MNVKFMLVAVAWLIAACASDKRDQLAAVEGIDQQAQFEETTACSAAMLTSVTCRGPWKYNKYQNPCYSKRPDATVCGTSPGSCNGTCLHTQIGGTAQRTTEVACSRCTPTAVLGNQCSSQANSFLAQVNGNQAQVAVSSSLANLHVEIIENDDGTVTRLNVATCNITLQNAAVGESDLCPRISCQVANTCRNAGFGDDSNPAACSQESNVFDTNTYASASSGLTVAQATTADKYLNPSTVDCSTLEDRQVNAARLALTVARSSASDPFWSALPAADALEAAARHDLIKEAKLMFELGFTSSSVTADTLRALYDSSPEDEMSCGVAARAAVSDACRSWGTTNHLDGPVGLCQRLLSTHIASAVFGAEIDRCLDLLNRPELGGAESCAAEYRDLVETIDEQFLTRAISAIQIQTGSSAVAGLGATLSHIDHWYAAAAKAFSSSAAALSDATGRVLSAFWTRVYTVGAPIPSFATGTSGSDAAASQLASLFTARIETDRQVLAAAFASPAPLDEVPLLLIVSDALTSINDRLLAAAPLYDLACRLKGGCTTAEANEATLLIRLIGAIGNDTELGNALTAATTVRGPWRDMFTALKAQRAALEAAFRKATGRPAATLADLYASGSVPPAAELARQVAGDSALWNRYVSHGLLLPENGLLRTNLTSANVTGALTAFQDAITKLTDVRREYQQKRGDLAQTVLNRINNQQYQDRITNETSVLRTDYDHIGSDLSGLMGAQDQAEQLIGSFLAMYVARASSPGWLPNFPVQGHPGHLAVDATMARGSGGLASDVTAVAVRDPQHPADPWRIDFARGDVLTFDVSGSWSPTCALRKTSVVTPKGPVGFADPTHLQIGPEGFAISQQNEQFVAKKHDSNDFSSQSDTSSICGSVSAGLGASASIVSASLSATFSTCRQWQTGHSDSDTSSNGSQFQYAANFSAGLRVPRAPFPTFPVGSLLLVEVVDGPGGQVIRDAHVVHPHATFVFPQAGKAYLVVNDEHDDVGCRAVDTSPLSVTYVQGASTAAASAQLADAMATILTSLQTAKASYVAQGSVTATELSSLQSAAYDQLRAKCHCNLSAFPDEVRGMFDAWLGAELAAIERQTRIVAAERALDNLVLRIQGLQDDLAGAANSSRLLSLMTYWQLGNLAYQLGDSTLPLRGNAERLVGASSDMLALLRILYPQALDQLRSSVNQTTSPITPLRTFDWTLPYDQQVVNLENVGNTVRSLIDGARNAGGLSTGQVVVVFPKPGATVNVLGSVTAPAERAKDVWEACGDPSGYCLRRKPVFTITPDDVYGRPLVGLGCQEAAPVVQSFAMVIVNDGPQTNQDWNDNPQRADILRGPEMKFPTESGILGYRTDGVGGILAPSRVRVLAAVENEVGKFFGMFVRNAGGDLQGVSPFNPFSITLGDAVSSAEPLQHARAVVAYFDVQTRTASSPLTTVGACVPVGTAP